MAYLETFIIVGLLLAFPPVGGTHPGLGLRAGYVPPMKEASVMWRRGDEGGEGMSISNYGAISDCGWAGY